MPRYLKRQLIKSLVAYKIILSLSHTHTHHTLAHTPRKSEPVTLRDGLFKMCCRTAAAMTSLIGSELTGAIVESDRKLEKRVPRETRCLLLVPVVNVSLEMNTDVRYSLSPRRDAPVGQSGCPDCSALSSPASKVQFGGLTPGGWGPEM